MNAMCPHCGFNLAADEMIELGDWRLAPAEAWLAGKPLNITKQQAMFLHTLAKARGRSVSLEMMGERICEGRSRAPDKLAASIARDLRARMAEPPFETVYGNGYRWRA